MYHKLWYDRRRKFWMVQFVFDWTFSLGIHVDLRRRYVDLHIAWFTVSVGINAPYSDYLDSLRWDSRGGIRQK